MNDAIRKILTDGRQEYDIITALKERNYDLRPWNGSKGLRKEYDPTEHPVNDRSKYPDVVGVNGTERVTRITFDLQRLATKRMTELVCGIPVKRIYRANGDKQSEIARMLESIYVRNRIDSMNVERFNMLFASCEVMTLWYSVSQENYFYGFRSPNKIRCANYSPMSGDDLYPYFDEYGDMIAMSVGYSRKVGKGKVSYFDLYTEDRHIKWSDEGGQIARIEEEPITLGKIPAIYMYRPTPVWEDTSNIVYEMEWAMSRNGNYLRKNSKPIFAVFADQQISYGNEKDVDEEFRSILQYPQGSSAQYITWPQAVDNLKFYVGELRQSFFTQLQLPDWSYENMKTTPMSGEARKQMYIDCQLKVKDESGRLLEFLDREMNVVKAFLKTITEKGIHDDIDALEVEMEITPFTINDEKDTVTMLMTANGGLPLMSHRESVETLGWSTDIDKTMEGIVEDRMQDAMEATL